MSTHFMSKLMADKGEYFYEKVETCYRKEEKNGLFAYDQVFMPMTTGSYKHWTLLVLYPKKMIMQYFNSLPEKDDGTEHFNNTISYLAERHRDTK